LLRAQPGSLRVETSAGGVVLGEEATAAVLDTASSAAVLDTASNSVVARHQASGLGRDLAGDVPALADPGDDQPPARRRAKIDRDAKAGVESFGELFEPLDLGADDPAGDRNISPETARLMMDGNAAQCPIERSGNGFFPQNNSPR